MFGGVAFLFVVGVILLILGSYLLSNTDSYVDVVYGGYIFPAGIAVMAFSIFCGVVASILIRRKK